MLSNELIKAIVESEFKDFIAIPSLEDASKYNLLNILSFNTGNFQSKLRGIAELVVNYGPLNLKTTPKQAMHVNELINKAEEERICIYDPTNCLTKANLKLGVGIKPTITKPAHELEMSSSASHGQRFHSEKISLDLGVHVITKKKLQYEHIAEMLKKLTSFTEDFVKLGRKYHLLIIYEVLYAEKLKDLSSSSKTKTTTKVGIGSTCKPTVNSPEQKTLASGNGEGFSVEKEIQYVKSWWGPEELGPRPIAYKCGEIRLICHKGGKKSFRLTTMDKFYKPFDATDDDSHIPTCKEPS